MSNGKSKSTQQAQAGLAAAVRSLKEGTVMVPALFVPYTPLELYERFLLVNADHKGNLSSMDGEYGRAVLVKASFDFGDLILPGLATAKVSATGKVSVLQVALLIVQRCVPQILSGPSGAEASWWTCAKPVCFLSLSGKRKVLSLTLGSEVSIGKELKPPKGTTPEGLGLSLELKASLKAGVSIKGQSMSLKDPDPAWYVQGKDDGLKKDFNAILGQGSKKNLKQEVVNWCLFVLNKLEEQLEKDKDPRLQELQQEILTIKSLNAVSSKLKELGSDKLIEKLTENISDETASNIFSQLANNIGAALNKPKTAQLIKDMKKLENYFIKINKAAPSEEVKTQLKQIQDQIKWYTDSLNAFQETDTKLKLLSKTNGVMPQLKPSYQELAFLSVFSFIPSASASASANANADGSLDAGQIKANANANASAQAMVSGQLGYTSFRYQSFGLSYRDQPLVLTQDTVLNYRQINASLTGQASASIKAELPDYNLSKSAEKEIEKEKAYNYNMLTYRAVITYWQYPQNESATTVKLESGSGLSFGSSVSFGRLVKMAKLLNKNSWKVPPSSKDKNLQLLSMLAKQLRVKPEELSAFLQAADIVKGSYPELEAYTSVLLESSFGFTISSASILPLKKKSTKKNAPRVIEDTLKSDFVKKAIASLDSTATTAKPTPDKPTLAAIRLRVRMADHVENEKTLFKLGMKVAAGLKIALNKVQSVGNESVLDVYVHWYGAYAPYNENDSPEAYEQSVPAVALLHQ